MDGRIFGLLTLLIVAVLFSRLLLQWLLKALRRDGKPLPKFWLNLNREIMRVHRPLGFVALALVLVHLFIMWTSLGAPSKTGLLAAAFLLLQGLSGFGMISQRGERRKNIARGHTVTGLLLVLAILFHRL